jgi:hypothetical protein
MDGRKAHLRRNDQLIDFEIRVTHRATTANNEYPYDASPPMTATFLLTLLRTEHGDRRVESRTADPPPWNRGREIVILPVAELFLYE